MLFVTMKDAWEDTSVELFAKYNGDGRVLSNISCGMLIVFCPVMLVV
jgi:hypothetical protein